MGCGGSKPAKGGTPRGQPSGRPAKAASQPVEDNKIITAVGSLNALTEMHVDSWYGPLGAPQRTKIIRTITLEYIMPSLNMDVNGMPFKMHVSTAKEQITPPAADKNPSDRLVHLESLLKSCAKLGPMFASNPSNFRFDLAGYRANPNQVFPALLSAAGVARPAENSRA